MNEWKPPHGKAARPGKRFAAGAALLLAAGLLAGCGLFGGGGDADGGSEPAKPAAEIVRYDGPMSRAVDFVYTARKELSLTFNGMADPATMDRLLDELDKYGIRATFFLPGMRVAEEPDIAKAIAARGHEIENNTLNRLDMSKLPYEQVYSEIKLSNDVIRKRTGAVPRYVRTKSGDYTDDVRLAAAQLGMEAVVSYNINPKDREMQSAAEIGKYVERFMTRGGIINLDTDVNPEVIGAIAYIADAADDIGYKLVPLRDLMKNGGERKPLERIPGWDAAKINPDYKRAQYKLVYRKDGLKDKRIALTFDDWGSDKTITKILDILAAEDVKATFFLRAKGTESNPNLARAMIEGGHDVANHSYSHPVVTTLSPEALQADIVKAHRVITEAIQQQPTMLFRPPTGVIDDATGKVVAATGYPVIAMYEVTTLDWDAKNRAADIVQGILKQTTGGSVILLHMLDDIHTIEALPTAIEQLKKKGFTFVKMADLIGLQPQGSG
ncbi:polysaccharide deacetylase family protein [Paenibacillus sp. MWE-103]|uniref:Polysaccharide deacetylase family protein n=1 Tax=Paenibacillus artemisiicola TaxID=1172618 RepID=A0ABS3WI61_9BACL|nr:polysaccharide deacetylase family protein [Paenibacillus artemisiicola]MBO7748008.1 polysaccharide deacetylase family protein [Paenibacillus artemisiicola]